LGGPLSADTPGAQAAQGGSDVVSVTKKAEQPSTRRAAGIVGIAVIASRLFGLVRDTVFAAMFGAGKLLDVYLASFQIPNLLRDLFAEGALSIAFTTMFTTAWDTEGEKPAWELANLILSAMLFLMGLLCVIAIIAAPLLVEATSFGYHSVPGKFELTVRLTRILFPFILFVSMAAAVMGMLNARHVFGIPASASTVFNIVSVVAGVTLALVFDPGATASWPHPHFTEKALYGVSLGVLLGGVAQLGMQLPSLHRLGFRFHWRLDLKDPRLAQLWALMWPSVVAGAAVQVNVLVNGNFASEINGGRSWLACAFRLMQFPIGIFGVSLATATLPAVARAFARRDMVAFGRTVRDSVRLAWFLALPASAGLAFLARPIIALIYQHGRFSVHDTLQTAHTLQAYSIGLAGYAAIKVLTPCFYALGLPKTPLRISLVAIAVNLILNTLNATLFGLGVVGLALATSSVALLNFGQLIHALSKQVDLGGFREWAAFLVRCAGAAALCGGAAYGIDTLVEGATSSWFLRGLGLSAAIGVSLPVYFGAARVLRLQEGGEAWRMIRRRIPGLG
jgi:putative peptidoglycan lipid II flippase